MTKETKQPDETVYFVGINANMFQCISFPFCAVERQKQLGVMDKNLKEFTIDQAQEQFKQWINAK